MLKGKFGKKSYNYCGMSSCMRSARLQSKEFGTELRVLKKRGGHDRSYESTGRKKHDFGRGSRWCKRCGDYIGNSPMQLDVLEKSQTIKFEKNR